MPLKTTNNYSIYDKYFRLARGGVGIFLLVILVSGILTPQLMPITGKSIVNAKLRWDRTPIDGKVSFSTFNLGDHVVKGEPLGTVNNERAEDGLLESLLYEESLVKTAITTLGKRYEKLKRKKKRLEFKLELANSKVTSKARRSINILERDLDLSIDKHTTINAKIESYESANKKLTAAGKYAVVSRKLLDDLHAELKVTIADIRNQRDKLAIQKLNMESNDIGIFISDSTPIEQERLKDVEDSLLWLEGDLEGNINKVNVISQAIKKRKLQAELQTRHEFQASVTGIIWDIGYTDGSYVHKGDPLIAIADTDSLQIDCIFHQRYLDNVHPGDFALVNLMGSNQKLTGKVSKIMIRDQVKSADISAFNYLTPETNEFKVVVQLDENQNLPRIGQRAKVVITKKQSSPLLELFYLFTK